MIKTLRNIAIGLLLSSNFIFAVNVNDFNNIKNQLLQLNQMFLKMQDAKLKNTQNPTQELNKKIEMLNLKNNYLSTKFQYDKMTLQNNPNIVKEEIQKLTKQLRTLLSNMKNTKTILIDNNNYYKINGIEYYLINKNILENGIIDLKKSLKEINNIKSIIKVLNSLNNVSNKYLMIYNETITSLINNARNVIQTNLFQSSMSGNVQGPMDNGIGSNNATMTMNTVEEYLKCYKGLKLSNNIIISNISRNKIVLEIK